MFVKRVWNCGYTYPFLFKKCNTIYLDMSDKIYPFFSFFIVFIIK